MKCRAKHPFVNLLIINDDPRFREESGETFHDTEFLRRLPAVVRATSTPEIEFRAARFQPFDVFHHFGNRDSCGSYGANQGVIDIDVDNHSGAFAGEYLRPR